MIIDILFHIAMGTLFAIGFLLGGFAIAYIVEDSFNLIDTFKN